MTEDFKSKLWDVIQDYTELAELIPDDNGGRLLKLINEKHQKLFFQLTDHKPLLTSDT
ncbi:hypothetical protein GCM10007876_01490 [Litoribrevibacter albus]|uniref:Uncharacterized protein n=1 Tax=Litoribrevibacter albus TaxID=1473156 RepID=A0AA37S7B2_9GAMM|nr:hypothetical protein GCM10007876_01490 [Litoribrevibacter albus]